MLIITGRNTRIMIKSWYSYVIINWLLNNDIPVNNAFAITEKLNDI